jgi:hypothetical protein
MKKVLVTVILGIAVLGAWNVLLAQPEDRDTPAETKDMRRRVRGPVFPNEPPARPDTMRQQERERALSAREKRRERMMKMREARVKQLQEAGRARAAQEGPAENAKAMDHEQQIKQLETQMNHEEGKHNKRVARLNRIKELAEPEGSQEVLARIEKLLQKEQRRYSFKRQRMDMKMRTFKRIQGRKENLGLPGDAGVKPQMRGPGGRPPRGFRPTRGPAGKSEQPGEEAGE